MYRRYIFKTRAQAGRSRSGARRGPEGESILAYVIYAAEAATLLWFAAFLALAHRLLLESRALPRPRLDVPGRRLLLATRLGFAVGLTMLAVAVLAEI